MNANSLNSPIVRMVIAAVFASLGVVLTYGLTVHGQTVMHPDGQLHQAGISNFTAKESNQGWTWNSFSCDSGYSLTSYHFDEGSSNNATWYACVPNGSGSVGGSPPPTNTCDGTCLANDPGTGGRYTGCMKTGNCDTMSVE